MLSHKTKSILTPIFNGEGAAGKNVLSNISTLPI